jgi:hypothetical protein
MEEYDKMETGSGKSLYDSGINESVLDQEEYSSYDLSDEEIAHCWLNKQPSSTNLSEPIKKVCMNKNGAAQPT